MSQGQMMAAMNAGMASTPLMPAGTPPAMAMRGYDLGPASLAQKAPVEGIAFEGSRNPLETVKNVFKLLGM